MELRPYQKAAVKAVEEEWHKGRTKTLLVLPTGTGKTIAFAAITKDCVNEGDRVLILAHRGELLEQASAKLMQTTGLKTALEKAEHSCLEEPFRRVVVGSVQTLMRERRLDMFHEGYFDTIIIDEAHHAVSDSYKRILEHFYDARVLGVTATA
ncbi:MAG: DEAD/DEAH box helicase family protein, partial [Veillonellaceae bacterium]|nr:DEAD/DEAH box helicase family protein [Veillonellaceae bacterium]